MKLCSVCGTTYEDRVDFCFQDGSPLARAQAPVSTPLSAGDTGPDSSGPSGVSGVGEAAPTGATSESAGIVDSPKAKIETPVSVFDPFDETDLPEPAFLGRDRSNAPPAPDLDDPFGMPEPRFGSFDEDQEPTQALPGPRTVNLDETAPVAGAIPDALLDAPDAPLDATSASADPLFDAPDAFFGLTDPPGFDVGAEADLPDPSILVQPSVAPTAEPAAAPSAEPTEGEEPLAPPTPLVSPSAPASVPAPAAEVLAEAKALPEAAPIPVSRPLVRPPRKPVEAPVRAPEPVADPEETPPPGPLAALAPAASDDFFNEYESEPAPASSGGKMGLLVGLAAISVALVLVGGWWMTQGSPPPPTPAVVAAPAKEPAPVAVAAPPPPAPVPVVEPTPVVEPVAEPVPEPVPEPAVEPAVEPVPAVAPQPRTPTPTPAPQQKRTEPNPAPPPADPAPTTSTPWGAPVEQKAEGTLSVSTTPPGAKVFVDDREVGRAPLDRLLPHGEHTVRVELPGYKSDARAVRLAAERLAVSFELRPEVKLGKVAVFGVPQSRVSIDGSFVGTVPLQTQLSEGSHAFSVEMPDGQTFQTVQEVRFGSDGRPVTINLSSP